MASLFMISLNRNIQINNINTATITLIYNLLKNPIIFPMFSVMDKNLDYLQKLINTILTYASN